MILGEGNERMNRLGGVGGKEVEVEVGRNGEMGKRE